MVTFGLFHHLGWVDEPIQAKFHCWSTLACQIWSDQSMSGCRNPPILHLVKSCIFCRHSSKFDQSSGSFVVFQPHEANICMNSSLSVKEMGTEHLKFTSWSNLHFWWFLCHRGDSMYFTIGLLSHPSLATVLPPLYRTTCVSRHPELRTAWSCWSKVLPPACLVINATKILLLSQCTWLSTHAFLLVYVSIS